MCSEYFSGLVKNDFFFNPLQIPVGFFSSVSQIARWFLVLFVIIVSANLVDTE